MRIESFPNCCSAKVITGVQACASNGTSNNPENAQHFKIYLKSLFDPKFKHPSVGPMGFELVRNMGFVCVTTIDHQKWASDVLEEFGWHSSDWLKKKNHPESKVKLWWIGVEEAHKLAPSWEAESEAEKAKREAQEKAIRERAEKRAAEKEELRKKRDRVRMQKALDRGQPVFSNGLISTKSASRRRLRRVGFETFSFDK